MRWRAYKHVFFDCDSTLTRIEGIDELATMLGRGAEVRALTQQAMEGQIPLEEVFQKRLDLLRPTRGQIERIGELYVQNLVEDAREVVQALKTAGANVYVLSGGFVLALQKLAAHLGIPLRSVVGVDIAFDELQGDWYKYHRHAYRPNPEERFLALDGTTPLVRTDGKRLALESLSPLEGGAVLVGDGASDLAAKDAVDLFIGYGGVARRVLVREAAHVYIECESLAPVLVLTLGPEGQERLRGTPHEDLYQKGLTLILEGQVRFAEPAQEILRSIRNSSARTIQTSIRLT